MDRDRRTGELLQAYLNTDYGVVVAGARSPLRVGVRCDALAALLAECGAGQACLLTAFNPRSRPLPAPENLARQPDLLARCRALGLRTLAADGRDPKGVWPPEDSLLILGIAFAAAAELAAAFEQNAFLFIGADAVPRLVCGDVMAGTVGETNRQGYVGGEL